jgi:hypothetical protein
MILESKLWCFNEALIKIKKASKIMKNNTSLLALVSVPLVTLINLNHNFSSSTGNNKNEPIGLKFKIGRLRNF